MVAGNGTPYTAVLHRISALKTVEAYEGQSFLYIKFAMHMEQHPYQT